MQRHAVIDPEQTRRDHRDPGRRNSRGARECAPLRALAASAHSRHPASVCSKRPHAPRREARCLAPAPAQEGPPTAQIGTGRARSRGRLVWAQGLQIERLADANDLQPGVARRPVRTAGAAGDDLHSAPPQFLDFFEYIGLDRRRKLVGEIGDRGHVQERRKVQSAQQNSRAGHMGRAYDRPSAWRFCAPGCRQARTAIRSRTGNSSPRNCH